MAFLAAALAGAAILVAAILALMRRSPAAGAAGSEGRRGPEPGPAPRSCPLCGSVLDAGERVKSDVSPGKGDRIMRIFGCPRCWPLGQPRVCPVCRAAIPPDGWAVARYFERPGRKHVHVLGCTSCRERRR